MAKNDGSQQATGEAPRVYRASAVHKRKAGKSARAANQAAAEGVSPSDETSPAAPVALAEGEQAASPGRAAAGEPAEAFANAAPGGAPSDDAAPGEAMAAAEPAGAAVADGKPADEATAESAGEQAGESAQQVEAPSAVQPEGGSEEAPAEKRGTGWRIAGIAAAIVIGISLVHLGYFAASRWFFSNDHANMQGTWYVAGTSVPVTITEDVIQLNDQTKYAYTLDTDAKTISFEFGGLEGQGHYWFNDDRTLLVITDGRDFDPAGTALGDLGHDLGDVVEGVFAGGAQTPQGEGITALSKTPSDSGAHASASAQSKGSSTESGNEAETQQESED